MPLTDGLVPVREMHGHFVDGNGNRDDHEAPAAEPGDSVLLDIVEVI